MHRQRSLCAGVDLTSLSIRSLREASGEAEAGEMNAQMNAIGQSNPSVANPSHPATLMAAACGCARWRASRPGNYPKKTMMTVATVMSTANTKKAIASRTSKVEATVEAPFVEIRGSNLGWCHASSVNLERPALTTDRPPTRLLAVTLCQGSSIRVAPSIAVGRLCEVG
jgi:hypothetical protein